jgi:hypothetical protein
VFEGVKDSEWSADHIAAHNVTMKKVRGFRSDRPRDDAEREEDLPEEGTMTMTNKHENLPRPAEELEELAAYYGSHDTADEMEDGVLVDPRPMQTTSLRLPADVVEALKSLAQAGESATPP